MHVSTQSSSSNQQVGAKHLIAALIRHSGNNVSPQQAIRAAESITEEFSLQPRNTYTSSSKKTKTVKKNKPTKKGSLSTGTSFAHVHDSQHEVGDRSVDIAIQQDSIEWDTTNSQLVLNLSRKQTKRLRAALSAYLYNTQESGESLETTQQERAQAA